MKTLRPAPSRCIGALILITAVTAAASAGWGWVWSAVEFFERMERSGRGPRPETRVMLYGGLAVIAGIGLLCALGRLSLLRARYEIGALDVVVHQGLFWRSTATVPILDVLRIEVASGPLQRILGHADLRLFTPGAPVYPVTLHGVPDAEVLRRYLLDRREALREAARNGDLELSGTMGELMSERLAKAIQRLEARLPSPATRS